MAERLAGEISFEEYLENDAVRLAVERLFITIGEALAQAQKLDPEAIAEIGHVREIISFRNILVHGYAMVDDRVVWNALQQHLPRLRAEALQVQRRFLAGDESEKWAAAGYASITDAECSCQRD
jgi:uncharacterized protein with HEPN domain